MCLKYSLKSPGAAMLSRTHRRWSDDWKEQAVSKRPYNNEK